tara:strand:+ start:6312 stop:6917 length:606 start_codon:yes stop_codon:yes gene_type:complete
MLKPPGNKKILSKCLLLASLLLNENKIKYCISWGTLLGCVRDGDIIEDDDDLDFYIDSNEVQNVKKIFIENDFTFRHIHSPIATPYNILQFIKIIENTKVFIDFYPYKNTNLDYVIDYYNHAPYHLKKTIKKATEDKEDLHIPKNYFFPFRLANFKKCKVNIPNNPIALMEWSYGTKFIRKLKEKEYEWRSVSNHPSIIIK